METMKTSSAHARLLLMSAALAALASGAQAQQSSSTLEEVVVTATRQTDTVNRVPLSITAVTQKSLDQQGIRSLNDLQRTVPSLSVADQAGTSLITIRGIGSNIGAATTGVYLDDTPLQKRGQPGVIP